jgi:RimJ/RimL family protein N-acetyltransferase
MIRRAEAGWREHGLGYWALVLAVPVAGCGVRVGEVIGTGGVSVVEGDVWNLGYRLTPAAWGYGLAGEVAAEALACARAVAPGRAVVARLLAENTASRRVAERAGLTLVREDVEPSGPAAGRRRLTFSDRPLPAA